MVAEHIAHQRRPKGHRKRCRRLRCANEPMGQPTEKPSRGQPEQNLERNQPLPERGQQQGVNGLLIRGGLGTTIRTENRKAVTLEETLADLTPFPCVRVEAENREGNEVGRERHDKKKTPGRVNHIFSIEQEPWVRPLRQTRSCLWRRYRRLLMDGIMAYKLGG